MVSGRGLFALFLPGLGGEVAALFAVISFLGRLLYYTDGRVVQSPLVSGLFLLVLLTCKSRSS
jgi:hypothetical protein